MYHSVEPCPSNLIDKNTMSYGNMAIGKTGKHPFSLKNYAYTKLNLNQ